MPSNQPNEYKNAYIFIFLAHFEWDAATQLRRRLPVAAVALVYTQSFNESPFFFLFSAAAAVPTYEPLSAQCLLHQYSLASSSSSASSGPSSLSSFVFDCIFESDGKHNNNIEIVKMKRKKKKRAVRTWASLSLFAPEFVISELGVRSRKWP